MIGKPTIVVALLSLTAACNLTDPRPVQLSANFVDPSTVDAVSKFNSCAGHAYPEQNSPNSGKNYFWPNSTNFSTTNVLKEYAACDGTASQASDDLSANEDERGETLHLNCDHSSTALRYFHVAFAPTIVGQHVNAGDFLGYAVMLDSGQTPSAAWQTSSNFDIAVSENNDDNTEDYFAKLTPAALAAWTARGLSSVTQTINPGNPTCANFNSNIGDPDIFSFSPIL